MFQAPLVSTWKLHSSVRSAISLKGRTNACLRPFFYDKSAFFKAVHCDIFLLIRALQSGVYCEGRGPPKSHAANSVTAAIHQNPM